MRNTINKTLHFGLQDTVRQGNNLFLYADFRQQYEYLSVVYLENGCRPCYPKFIEWQNKIDSLGGLGNHTVLFIIKGYSYDEFMRGVLDVAYVEDKYYTIMDPYSKFLTSNKDIPRWMMDGSLLIDSENKIKMVGTPWANKEMTALFQSIVNEQ